LIENFYIAARDKGAGKHGVIDMGNHGSDNILFSTAKMAYLLHRRRRVLRFQQPIKTPGNRMI